MGTAVPGSANQCLQLRLGELMRAVRMLPSRVRRMKPARSSMAGSLERDGGINASTKPWPWVWSNTDPRPWPWERRLGRLSREAQHLRRDQALMKCKYAQFKPPAASCHLLPVGSFGNYRKVGTQRTKEMPILHVVLKQGCGDRSRSHERKKDGGVCAVPANRPGVHSSRGEFGPQQ